MSAHHKYKTYDGPLWPEVSLAEFIYDRHEIYRRKTVLGQNPPWTENPVLQKYVFCNVFRRLDKGTRHVIEKVCENSEISFEEKLYNILLYRRFNVFGFFGQIIPCALRMEDFNANELINLFDLHRSNGKQVYNIAYNLCQVPFSQKLRPKDKHVQILLSVCDAANRRALLGLGYQAEKIFDRLQDIHGVGAFLAYQILQDISYIPGVQIDGLGEFTYVGPGATGGLDILYGNHEDAARKCKDLWNRQGALFAELAEKTYLAKVWSSLRAPTLSLGDMQSCLCEFRKYVNLVENPKAHKKRYYKIEQPEIHKLS